MVNLVIMALIITMESVLCVEDMQEKGLQFTEIPAPCEPKGVVLSTYQQL